MNKYKQIFQNELDNIEKSEYILCTGLFDDHNEDLKYYKDLFEKNIKKKMICTNPDLIVDRGNTREFCAGSVAMIFEKMGGEVVYFGKPYPEVYNQSIENKNKKVLSIGDTPLPMKIHPSSIHSSFWDLNDSLFFIPSPLNVFKNN